MNKADSNLVSRDNCVLLVIDVQEKLVPVISGADKIIKNIVKLIKFAKIINLPIVLTEQRNLGETVKEIKNELTGIDPILKITFSCFGSQEFVAKLRQLDKKHLIFTGIEAHICVAQTALESVPDYSPYIITDAISSRADHDCNIAIERMKSCGATLSSTEMLMYELLVRAGTDEFRKALKLVTS